LARQPEERVVIAAHQTMMGPQGGIDPYAGINAFEFYGASSFTAAVFIKSLRSGVSSTTIDWGDGATTTATTGKYQHNYASGPHVCTVPDDVYEFNDSNQTPYMANLRQILNCVSQTLIRSSFRCRSSGILTGAQRLSVPVLPAWAIDSVTGQITIELFNFSSFSGNVGDWTFPVCKQLSTITIHGKTCAQMLAMSQFPYITNCMQPTSADYINTQIVCDDGVIQYDLDTYGRTDKPTASKYKVTYT
jgi:hypothetical protein